MAETRSSAAAVACPGGDGGGKDGRGEHRSAFPSPSKRRKIEAQVVAFEPKEIRADESSLGRPLPTPYCLQGFVVERTADVIHDAHTVFPAAPDAPVLYRNQFLDIWACGRPLEVPWDKEWREMPLVLYDSDLTDAVKIKVPVAVEEEFEDLTTTISKVLQTHPGPIKRFHLGCTACPGEELLCEWIEVLSTKGVQEHLLLNLTQPTDVAFPLHCLRSHSLRSLALGFFMLDWQGADDDMLSSLQQLHLAACQFSGRLLSAVVCRLPCLRCLTIGGCDITTGCDSQGFVIESQTLRKLYLWRCRASALTIADAPDLQVLIAGVGPPVPAASMGRAATAVLINLMSAPVLRELHQFAMHCHTLQMYSPYTAKINRRRIMIVPTVVSLEIFIHMCVPRQACRLVGLLCRLPQLEYLIIWGDDPAWSKEWSLSFVPPCISEALEQLTVRCYRGGGAEIALVSLVLSRATRLVQVKLHPHSTMSYESAATADATFDGCPRANNDCEVLVGQHDDASPS